MKTSLILTLFSLLLTLPAGAQDFALDKETGKAVPNFVGQLKLLRGEVFKKIKGELEPVKIGDRFYKEDVLVTGEKSFARLVIADDTVLSIGPQAEINFARFEFKDKTDRRVIYNLIKGQLSGDVRSKAKPGEVVFKTVNTTMGVRGTVVLMNHQVFKDLEISEYALLKGEATVSLKDGEQVLGVGKRIVLVHNASTNETAYESLSLNEEDLKHLRAESLDLEKEERPLLPYFDPQTVKEESPLYALLHRKKGAGPAKGAGPTPRDGQNKNWRENLDKLNEQLKKNKK